MPHVSLAAGITEFFFGCITRFISLHKDKSLLPVGTGHAQPCWSRHLNCHQMPVRFQELMKNRKRALVPSDDALFSICLRAGGDLSRRKSSQRSNSLLQEPLNFDLESWIAFHSRLLDQVRNHLRALHHSYCTEPRSHAGQSERRPVSPAGRVLAYRQPARRCKGGKFRVAILPDALAAPL